MYRRNKSITTIAITFISILLFLSGIIYSCSSSEINSNNDTENTSDNTTETSDANNVNEEGTNVNNTNESKNETEDNTNNDEAVSSDNELKFKKGEIITYKLWGELSGITAYIGNQTFEVLDIVKIEDKLHYYVKSVTTLLPEIEKQFNYDYEDKLFAYIDVNTMYPRKIIKELKQGDYEDYVEIELNQKEKKGVYKGRKHPNGKEFNWEDNGLLDLLSAVYYVRSKELEIDDVFSMFILDEKTFKSLENRVKVVEGEPYKSVPTRELEQINEIKDINSIDMRLIEYKDKYWIPVNIKLGIKLGANFKVNLEGVISSYNADGNDNNSSSED
ncbi:MAG: DUF3108 domain-containing protein [Spirochaetota bacterium]